MTDETPESAADESQGPELDADGAFVLATYREIAARFRLGGPGAARTKVKRAKWAVTPRSDHSADPLRIQVPREAWDRAAEIRYRAIRSRSGDEALSRGRASPSHHKEILHLGAVVALLREQVERERQIADEARAGRAAAERRAARAEDDLRAERDGFRRREEELARLAALLPAGTKLPDLPSIREGLAELAAEFTVSSTTQPLTANPANRPSILEGLSELALEFSASPPEQPRPAEALPGPLGSSGRSPTKPNRVDELPIEGAVQFATRREDEGPVESLPGILPIELNQATVTTQAEAELVAAHPVGEDSTLEPSIASPLQQDPAPVEVAKSRPRWLRFRRPGPF